MSGDAPVVGRWIRPYQPAVPPGPLAYDATYAGRYDEDWWESERWAGEAENHLADLAVLLAPDGVRWLDCGCGTGWLLSRFPGVDRAGFDLTPAMLDQARAASPDATFIERHDLREDRPEWHDRFDLVTCTGQPWMYLTSLEEVGRAVANMAGWTAPTGTLYIPIADITDLAGLPVDLDPSGAPPPEGHTIVTGAFWSQNEYGGMHHHMIAPSLGTWIELMARHFRTVEVWRWPHRPAFLPVARRVVLGRDRRGPDDQEATEVLVRAIPGAEGEEVVVPTVVRSTIDALEAENGRLADDLRQLRDAVATAEERARLAEGRAAEGDDARARLAEAANHPPHVCPPNRSAAAVPTGSLVRELGRRLNPADGRAARAAWRRVRRIGPAR